jgi:hypothetical protein
MLTYQDPQIKYWRNMNVESWVFSFVCIMAPTPSERGKNERVKGSVGS